MTEGRDWTRSQFERCPDCGADAAAVADDHLGDELIREVAAWGRVIAAADPGALRIRPVAEVWSALEYACHVRDLLPVMEERIVRVQVEDNAELGWWDHEAAVKGGEYQRQDPVLVIEAMSIASRSFSTTLTAVADHEWDRAATRRPGEEFTIRGMARFVLHEVIHHRDDAIQSLHHAEAELE